MKVKYTRVYSDKEGKSHFSNEEAEVKSTNFAPLFLSRFSTVTRLAYLVAPPNWVGKSHLAPHRQFTIFLSGDSDIESGDGENRHFGSGRF